MSYLKAMPLLVTLLLFSTVSYAQYEQLDPKPYDPDADADIDMYMHSWTESMPRHTHGSLIERDIRPGDHGAPAQ